MKSLIQAVALAAVLAVPVVSFAQAQTGNGPLTRAQVRGELVQLERAGYRPSVNDQHYPNDIQSAEARVAGRDTSGYGPSASGSSQSGGSRDGAVSSYSPPVYFGH